MHVLARRRPARPDGDGAALRALPRQAGTGGRQLSGAPGRARPDRRAGGALARAAGGGARADAPSPEGLPARPRWPARAQGSRVAFVLKGWPRLSETFIAQEILAPRAARPRRC